MVNQPPAFEDPAARKRDISTACMSVWADTGIQVLVSVIGVLLAFVVNFILTFIDVPWPLYWWIQDVFSMILFVAATVLGSLLAIWYGSKRMGISVLDEMKNDRFDKSWLIKGVCMGYGITIPLGLVVTLISLLVSGMGGTMTETTLPSGNNFVSILLVVVLTVLIAPILEECLFRGVIFKGLSKYNAGFAVVFSSVLFGMAHMNLDQGIPVFGLALVMAYVYYRSGSLNTAIFVHIINNLIAVIMTYLPQYGPMVIFYWMLTMIVVGLAVAGWYFFYAERREIKAMFSSNAQAKRDWKAVAGCMPFWLFVILFVMGSVFSLI